MWCSLLSNRRITWTGSNQGNLCAFMSNICWTTILWVKHLVQTYKHLFLKRRESIRRERLYCGWNIWCKLVNTCFLNEENITSTSTVRLSITFVCCLKCSSYTKCIANNIEYVWFSVCLWHRRTCQLLLTEKTSNSLLCSMYKTEATCSSSWQCTKRQKDICLITHCTLS